MHSKEWIARDERERSEADIAEANAMRAIIGMVALILALFLAAVLFRLL